MPIYEFRRLERSGIFEIFFMSGNDEKDMIYPECGRESLERVLSASNHAVKDSSPRPSVDLSAKSRSGGSCGAIEIPGGYD